MAELKLFTSGDLLPPTCYLQIVTDSYSLDNYIGLGFPINVPTTFHVAKPNVKPYRRLNIASFKPPTCFLAFLIFAPQPQLKSNYSNDFNSNLGLATQSVKTFINLYNYTKFENVPHPQIPWLKERLNIFWFTTKKVTNSPELFPSKEFFGQTPANRKEPHYMYTTLFLVYVQSIHSSFKPNSTQLLFVCLHCTNSDNPRPVYVKIANISMHETDWISATKPLNSNRIPNILPQLLPFHQYFGLLSRNLWIYVD